MAVQWIELAWTLDLTPTQMLVAQAVADYANKETGLAWMSQETLAWKTGLTTRWISQMLKDLVELEVLIIVEPTRQHRTATYRYNSETSAPRKPLPDRKELPVSDTKPTHPDRNLTHPDRKSNAVRPEGASAKPSRTVSEPSSTDREEARRIADNREGRGNQINNRVAYEAKVAANLAEERNQREQAQRAAGLIAECELCNDQGLYFRLEPGEVTETGFRCPHANSQ